MDKNFYIERTLIETDRKLSETALLEQYSYIVILAEPGAGKSELMNSLANRLQTEATTASVFAHVGAEPSDQPIVIDAFDELSKIDNSGIHKLLANISRASPCKVIISSRSSEWSSSETSIFKQFIRQTPTIVRLYEFDESEQQEIYSYHTKSDDFWDFREEVSKFELEPLLPNPQFLKLFADAYVESNKSFPNKHSIFSQAIMHLARETNVENKTTSLLSAKSKIDIAAEIFTKLLLAGCEGVVVNEANETKIYPALSSLFTSEKSSIKEVLASRLFKPGGGSDQHLPVHKIVTEYSAADYLIRRIAAPSDSLSLEQCLTLVAPNSAVRDELRGLLGWMAAIGSRDIEEIIIHLDAYAVLANGDPSQLTSSSKKLLIFKLTELEEKDPFFRRADFGRSFSVSGFFSKENIEDIRPLITEGSDGQLKYLILELLVSSPIVKGLTTELRRIQLSTTTPVLMRIQASKCLLSTGAYDPHIDIGSLIDEASSASLHVASKLIKEYGANRFRLGVLEKFFLKCAELYPESEVLFNETGQERYFIKYFISSLGFERIEAILDLLTPRVVCSCGKATYQCNCLTGLSKVIGRLLDRYFELAEPPFQTDSIWKWLKNLRFQEHRSSKDSYSVKRLQEDTTLRHGLISYVFSDLKDIASIDQTIYDKFNGFESHSGLHLSLQDEKDIVNLAYEMDNPELWIRFIGAPHSGNRRNNEERAELRRIMRAQALEKPEFMAIWTLTNRQIGNASKRGYRKLHLKRKRRLKRNQRLAKADIARDIQFIQENRKLIENGQHYSSLKQFAWQTLDKPDEISMRFGDEEIVKKALRNSLSSVDRYVPNLKRLAELKCDSKFLHIQYILAAACLEVMRYQGNLNGVKLKILLALKAELMTGFSTRSSVDFTEVEREINRQIFTTPQSVESFLRQYIEVQLACRGCAHPQVNCLQYDVFVPFAPKLSIEWLRRYEDVNVHTLETLFDLAAKFGSYDELLRIISVRCSNLLAEVSSFIQDGELSNKCKFWFVRAFYFLELDESRPYFNWLALDKSSLLMLQKVGGDLHRGRYSSWPKLTSRKIEAILHTFFEDWPEVKLPSTWGTNSPPEELAVRYLYDIVWRIGNDDLNEGILVLDRLLEKEVFARISDELRGIRADHLRKLKLRDFTPPSISEVAEFLDNDTVASVEGLRQLILNRLVDYQNDIDGGEFNPAERFYRESSDGKPRRIDEVESIEIVAERLKLVLRPQSIDVMTEHQTKGKRRIDITMSKMIGDKRRLLVIEGKGQWNRDLYTAAYEQLYKRYSIHPEAEHQGIYLVIWFGSHEAVAGRKIHSVESAAQLKDQIEKNMPAEINGKIDIFVLDVSKPGHHS